MLSEFTTLNLNLDLRICFEMDLTKEHLIVSWGPDKKLKLCPTFRWSQHIPACMWHGTNTKKPWAETKCTEIYFQFSFVQISPLRSYCCMHLLLWGCLFSWALKLAIPSSLLRSTSDWSTTKLIKRQWQKSLWLLLLLFFRGGGGRVVKENDFTFRASILLHLISLQASFFNITLWVVLNLQDWTAIC